MYNREFLIKIDYEDKVCVVKIREGYEKYEGNKYYCLFDNILKFECNIKKI